MPDLATSLTAPSAEGDGHPNSPLLLAPLGAPTVKLSSPHLMTFDAFRTTYGGSSRRDYLLSALCDALHLLGREGIRPLCLLTGGSFVRRDAMPADLDALIVYSLMPDTAPDAVRRLQRRTDRDLDLRFVPGDVGPVPLLKMGCFFHTLYQSRNRDGDQGSILVILDDEPQAGAPAG